MRYIFILFITFTHIFAMDPFISPAKLKDLLHNEKYILLDVDSNSLYKKGHIVGAIHCNISKFIDSKSPFSLMNSTEILQEELRKLGINSDSNIVIYSHNTHIGILNSSYLALILIFSGLENVSILDGGYISWVFENELLVSSKQTKPLNKGDITVSLKPDIIVDLAYVQKNISILPILDARSSEFYFGTARSHNIDAIGHIPHARSSSYKDKFLNDTTLRKQEELDDIYIKGHELNLDDEMIIYGDNVFSASMEWYILYKKMGFKGAKIYEASLLEWGNIPELPIVKFKWEVK